jgi:hypothetical protein
MCRPGIEAGSHLNYIYTFSPYRAVNTLHVGYKNRSVTVVSGNNRCLLWDQHRTHNALCGHKIQFLKVKRGSTYSTTRLYKRTKTWRRHEICWTNDNKYRILAARSVQSNILQTQSRAHRLKTCLSNLLYLRDNGANGWCFWCRFLQNPYVINTIHSRILTAPSYNITGHLRFTSDAWVTIQLNKIHPDVWWFNPEKQ